jgi:hypothetical protein
MVQLHALPDYSKARLARLNELAAGAGPNGPGLLPAFGACLTLDEACRALVLLIEAQPVVRRALLNRVLYLAREGADSARLSELADELLAARAETTRRLPRIDAVISTLFTFFPLYAKHRVMDAWKSDKRRTSKSRWLKVIRQNPELFDADILGYWNRSRHWEAAKILAYAAPVDILREVLAELVEYCDEGWIIARAFLRSSDVPEELMERVKEKFPATYAYICAKTNRSLTHDCALDLYRRAGPMHLPGGRGLAAWSIGYLGMWDTLEEIQASRMG